MDKSLFQSIQGNFKTFLDRKKHPVIAVKPLPLPPKPRRVVELERTTAFGREDAGIGYKISTDNKTIIKSKRIVTEITQQEKELKKDYLLRQIQTQKDNKIPTWDKIWKELQRNDGFQDYLKFLRHEYEHEGESWNGPEVIERIKHEQRAKYMEIVQSYKNLDGENCWREMRIPRKIDPRTLSQLGIYWTVSEAAVEAHWAKGSREQSLDCTYEGIINLDIIDWPSTMYARMDYTLGDNEQEIRFIKNSKLFINSVIVYDNISNQVFHYEIRDWKRL